MKKRSMILLPAGCLLFLALLVVSSWASMRMLRSTDEELGQEVLEWRDDFGEGEPAPQVPEIVSMGPAEGDFTLPQVLSVEDAEEVEGGWLLLDSRLGKLHLLETVSGSVRSFGREGQGPGEFHGPVAVAVEDSVVWVLNERGLVLDELSLSGEFRTRTRIQGGGCLVGLGKDLSILSPESPILLRVCPATLPGPGTAWVERIESVGSLSPILSLTLGERGSRRLHLLRQPALETGSGQIYLGTWDSPCIGVFDPEGRRRDALCLPEYSRPKVPAGEKPEIEKRLRGVSNLGILPISVPDRLPWYDGFFSTFRGLVVRRIQGPQERDLVLLQPHGGPSVADLLLPENVFVGDYSILTVEDLLQGSRIKVYPNPWR